MKWLEARVVNVIKDYHGKGCLLCLMGWNMKNAFTLRTYLRLFSKVKPCERF